MNADLIMNIFYIVAAVLLVIDGMIIWLSSRRVKDDEDI